MKTNKLVNIHDDVPRAGTWLIAQGLERAHANVLKTIENNKSDFEEFSEMKSESHKTGGRPTIEYLLTEEQTTLLMTYLRNIKSNDKVRLFKKALVKEFYRMKRVIRSVKAQADDPLWLKAREEGKVNRLGETKVIQDFIEYAKDQGATPEGAQYYYENLTKMMSAALFIIEGKYKNLRNVMTGPQLIATGAAEVIIQKAISDGMKNNVHYKEVYKLAKERTYLFAEMHGQSKILSEQLQLFE
uniref:Putative regulatory protein n=1 Tax=viral metagenome TaxID=1070528 RepID=A0A6M3IU51_9ZZZZ